MHERRQFLVRTSHDFMKMIISSILYIDQCSFEKARPTIQGLCWQLVVAFLAIDVSLDIIQVSGWAIEEHQVLLFTNLRKNVCL